MIKKSDWTKVATATLVSVFIGFIVLAVVIYKRRKNKLSTKKLSALVLEDLTYWKGITETSRKGAEKLSEWWNNLGYQYSVDSLMNSNFQDQHYWSAIYISNLMKRWGAGDNFKYSARHSDYICDGLKAKNSKDTERIFWSYEPSEKAVSVGDMIGISRPIGAVTLNNICSGATTHVDLVYRISKIDNGYKAYLIGGNLGHTVKTTYVMLDKNKKILAPEKYLVIMKNQAL